MAEESKPQTLREMNEAKAKASSTESTADQADQTSQEQAAEAGSPGAVSATDAQVNQTVDMNDNADGDEGGDEPGVSDNGDGTETRLVAEQPDPNHTIIHNIDVDKETGEKIEKTEEQLAQEEEQRKAEEEEQERIRKENELPNSQNDPSHVLESNKPAAEATVDPDAPELVESGLDVSNIADPAAAELAEKKKSGSLEERLDAKAKSTDRTNANTGEATGDVKVEDMAVVNPPREIDDPAGTGKKQVLAGDEAHRVPKVPYGVEPMSKYVPTPNKTDLHGEVK